MVSALLRQVFFFPQTTRISILHRIPVLANARPNFPSPSLPLRNHTSRSLSTSALRLILQSPVSTIGYAPSSTLASLSPKHLDPLPWTIRIPPICPGCGARSQTTDPNVPGFYDQEKAQAKAIKRKEKKGKTKYGQEEECRGSHQVGESGEARAGYETSGGGRERRVGRAKGD